MPEPSSDSPTHGRILARVPSASQQDLVLWCTRQKAGTVFYMKDVPFSTVINGFPHKLLTAFEADWGHLEYVTSWLEVPR